MWVIYTPDDLSSLSDESFRDSIDQLKQLLSQSGQSFLLGAGCSCCANLPLTDKLTKQVCGHETLSSNTKNILRFLVQEFNGPGAEELGTPTIEDYMSDLIDLLSIAQRRSKCRDDDCKVLLDEEYSAKDLDNALQEIKNAIYSCINKDVEILTHRNFVRSVHGVSQSGKPIIVMHLTFRTYALLLKIS